MHQLMKEALNQFFSAQKRLNQMGVIQSRDYIGDIGRYLCTVMYGLKPAPRKAGYDGTIGTSRILVRINNCPTGTRVRLEESAEYDELIVVLAPYSLLRPEGVEAEFIFYRFTREEVPSRFRNRAGMHIGAKETFAQGYDRFLSLA
jgi:hypothetical protein